MHEERNDKYIEVFYNLKDKPLTQYPDLLTGYLTQRFKMEKGVSILDLGCGRGDFLRGFIRCGLLGFGIDRSLSAQKICPEAEIRRFDLTEKQMPYQDNTFDYIFSKSVIEHFYYPENIVREMFRIVKPEGLAIIMTPDWEYHYKIFYRDFTHRTPFTADSLVNILKINDFIDVDCEKFFQLPATWDRPWLKLIARLLAILTPERLSKRSKFVKFSKEVMLLGVGRKPKTCGM